MKMSVIIIPATCEDEDRVFRFLCEHYYPDEPLNVSVKRIPQDKEHCPGLRILQENMSFLAVEKDNPSVICGVVLNKEVTKGSNSDTWKGLREKNNGTPYGKVIEFLSFVEGNFREALDRYWGGTKTNRALDITILSVRRENQRQKLGFRMMECSIQLAKEKNYQLMTIKCTSQYSAALAQKVGFFIIYQLAYEEYKDASNQVAFKLSAPHYMCTCLIKELNATT